MPRRAVSILSTLLLLVPASAAVLLPPAATARAAPPDAARPPRLSMTAVDTEPRDGLTAPSPDALDEMRQQVADHPDDRAKRLALVRGLLAAKDTEGALAQAKAWRAKDAYNLVAVRALGDVYVERGDKEAAERVYSAIVELLPRDPDAQRALATLLKQRGDLPAAQARLAAALDARPDDARLLFELADVELRLGQNEDAMAKLEGIVAAPATGEQIRYPAKQRLGQVYGELRRRAIGKGDPVRAAELGTKIDALALKGGPDNDVHIYLTWDTNRTDVDLWVTTPSGEKVFYQHRQGKDGESLFDDVTTGYGPESFTAKHAQPGDYKVEVNYFSGHRGPFPEARGEVVVVLDEGQPAERKEVFPYRLFAEKQTVHVVDIRVGGGR
jgi:tetratricopeptide (TPR) repeat protein